VGASKQVPPDTVREAVALGLRDLGENRVQEASSKIAAVGRDAARWHLIGHLQRNKAAKAVELFDLVHSVDDVELATELSRRSASAGRVLPVLVEVNVSGESSKFGVAPDALDRLLDAIRPLAGVRLEGLMTVGRPVERAEDARADFVRLRDLRDRGARVTGLPLPELSMGMSGDYEVAIEEGATLVRVGTALFGTRTGTT
jgi:pyridoxal phosphate enzyme (YggS family)